ncbi:negative elongation factor A-like [Oratosquilla oratoria]|uniref:negative elongation factor A-like n=1 Tax=Oratosquilla oratoria TaxID=337810 RepID=UPI003F75C8CC
MAAVRDSDISLWLHNKLGTSSDTWTEGSICSQLNIEVLRNIKECFVELQTQVKLKLLLSFFQIPKRNVEEWRMELEEILEIAVMDSEPWVAMLAEIMKTFPASGSLNLDIRDPAENQRITHDLTTELRKMVRKHSELGLLPMECNYLNRNAFVSAAGQQPPLTKHFTLKRKPKAAALRVELLNRSADAQTNVKKSQLPTVPVRSRGMPRKMTDTTPLKGIPSRLPGSGARGSGLGSTPMSRPMGRSSLPRKDGGSKLLDISESPLAAQQAKKRRKYQDATDAKAADVENKLKEQQHQAEGKQAAQQQQQQQQQPTPDYAAGLTPSNPATPAPATPSAPNILTTGGGTTLHTNAVAVGTLTARSSLQSSERASPSAPTPPPANVIPAGTTTTPQRIIVNASPQVSAPTVVYRTVTPVTTYAQQTATPLQPTVITTQPAPDNSSSTPQYATLQPLQPDNLVYTTTTSLSNAAPQQTLLVSTTTASTQPQQSAHTQATINPQPQQPQQRRGLSLTKEQMLEAQEMFRSSNKVTRPEKALILGFMAGSRENPCPHLGSIVTIKLSEGEETIAQSDGSLVPMLAETHFQMNYNSGEWKRIKKYRPLPAE